DKTGTLTAPEMDLDDIVVAEGLSSVEEQRALDAFAALARLEEAPNATMRAIADALPAVDGWAATRTVPFSSARKFSAAAFADHGAWCVGAPEVVLPPDAPLRIEAERVAA